MSDDLEDMLKDIASIVYDNVKQFGIGDRAYERAMSEELIDRGIPHETHKKVFDERRGKYKFIDLYFPEHARFAKLKARKYITRTEIAELKEEEQIMGIEGMIINFYNGVTIRHSMSGRMRGNDFDSVIGFHPDNYRQQKHRTTLPHLSSSTSRLSDMSEPGVTHRQSKYGKHPTTALPLHEDKEGYKNANKIFALSCAAFFLSEGDRKEFSEMFNDMLESMKFSKISIPEKFLDGPRMRTPDGEVSDTIKKIFSNKLNKKENYNQCESPARNGNVSDHPEE